MCSCVSARSDWLSSDMSVSHALQDSSDWPSRICELQRHDGKLFFFFLLFPWLRNCIVMTTPPSWTLGAWSFSIVENYQNGDFHLVGTKYKLLHFCPPPTNSLPQSPQPTQSTPFHHLLGPIFPPPAQQSQLSDGPWQELHPSKDSHIIMELKSAVL